MASRQDVIKVLTAVEVAFPAVFQNMPQPKVVAMTNLWSEMFKDTPTNELQYAVKAFIANDTKGFPPAIGQINQIIAHAHDSGITEIEAWQMVKRAIRESYDYESAKHEWEKLPDEVRAPIRPGDLREWGQLNSDTVNSTISASYRRSFVEKRRVAQETKQIPQSVKTLLLTNRME